MTTGMRSALEAALDEYDEPMSPFNGHELGERLANRMRRALDVSPDTGDGWQDISTAPKDGTEIDLYGLPLENSSTPRRVVDCHYHCGDWLHWCTWEDDEGSWARIFKPTHWRYAPAAPTSKGSGQ